MIRGWLVLIGALCLCLPRARGSEIPVAERPVHLTVWGGSIDDISREIEYQTGAPVRFRLDEATEPVYLVTGRVPLSVVLETVARRFGLRFRITAAGSVEFSRGYDWASGERELRFLRLRPLAGAGKDDGDTRKLLAELLKPLPLLSDDFTVEYESYPLPGAADALRALALLPPVLADYIERAVACLQGDSGDYPPNRLRPPGYRARARSLLTDWEGILGRPLSSPRGGDYKTILADIADQASAVIMTTTIPDDGFRPLPADIDRYTFGRITQILAESRGLGKRVFLPDGGLLFTPGEDGSFETDARSREFFWEGLAVAGFPVRGGIRRYGSVDRLAGAIRREVYPSLWRDAVCGVVVSPVTERLVVIAPENVVEAVALWLETNG